MKRAFRIAPASNTNIGVRPFLLKYIFNNKLVILMYHGVVKEPLSIPDWCFIDSLKFSEQMRYLKANFNVLPLSQALKKLQAGNIQNPTASVTFDDGFLNNYEVAYPITSKLKIPITIYVSTRLVDTNRTLWFCQINAALLRTKEKYFEWRGLSYPIISSGQKSKVSSLLQRELKKLAHIEMLKELDNIVVALGVDPEAKLDNNSPFRMLHSEAIRSMSKSEYVEIGAHTHSHAILSKLSPVEKRKEILESIRLVERWTDSNCRTFAYPNGRFEDYDAECIRFLKEYKIETAVTANSHSNTRETSRFELGRYGIGSYTGIHSFKLLVHGITPFLNRVRSIFFRP